MKLRTGFVANSSSTSFIVTCVFNNKDLVQLFNTFKDHLKKRISEINGIIIRVSNDSWNSGADTDHKESDAYVEDNDTRLSLKLMDQPKRITELSKDLVLVHNDQDLLNLIVNRAFSSSNEDNEEVEMYENFDGEMVPVNDPDDPVISNEEYCINEFLKPLKEQMDKSDYTYPLYVSIFTYVEPEGYGYLWTEEDDDPYDPLVAYCVKNGIPNAKKVTGDCL